MNYNKNNYQDDLLDVIKNEQDIIYGNKEDVPKNKPIPNRNNDRDDDFDDIFANNTKNNSYFDIKNFRWKFSQKNYSINI